MNHSGAVRRPEALGLGVVCTFFPSRTQPWIVNSIEQAMLRGADPVICAFVSRERVVPEKVQRLGLHERTCYVRPGSPLGILPILSLALSRRDPFSGDARRGIGRVIRAGWRAGSPWKLLQAASQAPFLGHERLDLIHAHSLIPAYRFLPVLRIRNLPMVLTFHGLPPEGVGVPAEGKRVEVFSASRRVLVNTRFAAAQAEALGCPPDKLFILPQGIELEEFPFQPSVAGPGEDVRLLTVGRLQPDKGHRYALEAVAELRRRGHAVVYHIVGVGDRRAELQGLAKDLGISEYVRFMGAIPESALREEYRRAHIFVLPSLRDRVGRHEETQGVVIQEAQASGCVVVATRTGGIPECVDDGRSAFLVPDRDAGALARAVKDLITAKDRWPEIQREGRRWVECHFDVHRIGDRQWDVYQDVLREAPPR